MWILNRFNFNRIDCKTGWFGYVHEQFVFCEPAGCCITKRLRKKENSGETILLSWACMGRDETGGE